MSRNKRYGIICCIATLKTEENFKLTHVGYFPSSRFWLKQRIGNVLSVHRQVKE
jgi:hypothetical protein